LFVVLAREAGLSCAPDCEASDARDGFLARDEVVAVLGALAVGLLCGAEKGFFAGMVAERLARPEG